MHFLVVFPSSLCFTFLPEKVREDVASAPPSITGIKLSSSGTSVSLKVVLFFLPNIFGSGLLAERLCACCLAAGARGLLGSAFKVGGSVYSVGGGRGNGLSRA
jgi:hypothetical protein